MAFIADLSPSEVMLFILRPRLIGSASLQQFLQNARHQSFCKTVLALNESSYILPNKYHWGNRSHPVPNISGQWD
jgi:hypothetical protein